MAARAGNDYNDGHAWTGLSAAWFLGDGDPLAEIDLTIAQLAAAELDRMA